MEPEPRPKTEDELISEIDDELQSIQRRWQYLLQLKYEIRYRGRPSIKEKMGQMVIEEMK